MLGVDDIITSSGKYKDRAMHVTPAIAINAGELADKANAILRSFGSDRAVSSGFRTAEANKAAGGAEHSWHMTGQAVDLVDHDGDLGVYCLCEQALLEHFGLWLEDPRWTRKDKQKDGTWAQRWVHLQTKPPPSGRRVFRPAGPQPR